MLDSWTLCEDDMESLPDSAKARVAENMMKGREVYVIGDPKTEEIAALMILWQSGDGRTLPLIVWNDPTY